HAETSTSPACARAYEECAGFPIQTRVPLRPRAPCIRRRQTNPRTYACDRTYHASVQSLHQELPLATATRGAPRTRDGCDDVQSPSCEQTPPRSSLHRAKTWRAHNDLRVRE